jgi:Uncharacterized protein conserved in bacteria (DUF2188)
MPDITVHRHGDRWAVAEPGASTPAQEYATREEAELAARQLADGGDVRVVEDDPTGLDAEDSTEPVRTGLDEVKAVDAAERARSTQTGM